MKIKRSELENIIKQEIIGTLTEQLEEEGESRFPNIDSLTPEESVQYSGLLREVKGRKGYVIYGSDYGQKKNYTSQEEVENELIKLGLTGVNKIRLRASSHVLVAKRILEGEQINKDRNIAQARAAAKKLAATGQKVEFRLAPLDSKLYAIIHVEEEVKAKPTKRYDIYGDPI